MALLTLGLAAAIATAPAGDPVARWQPHIDEAATRFALPADWIAKVIRAESGGRTALYGRPIRSSAGAMGLMQLMPATWATMRARLRLGDNPDDPRDNILAGTAYLRMMHDRFGYPGLFGAYNLGPTGYARVLAGERRLPGETVAYLARLTRETDPVGQSEPPRLRTNGQRETLFVMRAGDRGEAPDDDPRPSLFVVRSDAR
nr:lytic transglycosylase domain-containing protein [Sphingomonas sp. Y57]